MKHPHSLNPLGENVTECATRLVRENGSVNAAREVAEAMSRMSFDDSIRDFYYRVAVSLSNG